MLSPEFSGSEWTLVTLTRTQVMLKSNKRILLLMTVDANDTVGPLSCGPHSWVFWAPVFPTSIISSHPWTFLCLSQVLKWLLFTLTSSTPSRMSLWEESFHHGIKVGRRRRRLDWIAVPSAQREMLYAVGGQWCGCFDTCQVVLITEGACQSSGTCVDKSEPACIRALSYREQQDISSSITSCFLSARSPGLDHPGWSKASFILLL